jgi:maleylpyruvate isomerase
MKDTVHLYGFWRSLATYRVRIALALKGIDFDEDYVDLLAGEQFQGEVARLNPQNSVPVLTSQDASLTQSLAILEYIEECFPEPPLLPANPLDRARVRAFALITIADSHPLVVPRVRKHLQEQLNASDDDVEAWGGHWSKLGLQAMETRLQEREKHTTFCFSDEPGLADIGLASQVTGAGYFGITIDGLSAIEQVMTEISARDEFVATSPHVIKANLTQN